MKLKFSLLLAALVATTHAYALNDRSGKDVVDEVCATCHTTGKKGAPRIGNAEDWRPRLARSGGLKELASNAISGVREMPAHGGQAGLTDLEISRAITYMIVPASDSTQVKTAYNSARAKDGADTYKAVCASCHADGKNGAPRITDTKDWTARFSKGVDVVVDNAVRGHNKMPARGGLASLTDQDIKSAAVYMFQSAAAPK